MSEGETEGIRRTRGTADSEMKRGGAKIGFGFTRRTTVIGDAGEKRVDESGVTYATKMKKKEDK